MSDEPQDLAATQSSPTVSALPVAESTGPSKQSKKNKAKKAAKKAKQEAKRAQSHAEDHVSTGGPLDLRAANLLPTHAPSEGGRRNSILTSANDRLMQQLHDSAMDDVISSVARQSASLSNDFMRRELVVDTDASAQDPALTPSESPKKETQKQDKVTEENKSGITKAQLEATSQPLNSVGAKAGIQAGVSRTSAAHEDAHNDPLTLVSDLPTSKLQEYIPSQEIVKDFEPSQDQLVAVTDTKSMEEPSTHTAEPSRTASDEGRWETDNDDQSSPWELKVETKQPEPEVTPEESATWKPSLAATFNEEHLQELPGTQVAGPQTASNQEDEVVDKAKPLKKVVEAPTPQAVHRPFWEDSNAAEPLPWENAQEQTGKEGSSLLPWTSNDESLKVTAEFKQEHSDTQNLTAEVPQSRELSPFTVTDHSEKTPVNDRSNNKTEVSHEGATAPILPEASHAEDKASKLDDIFGDMDDEVDDNFFSNMEKRDEETTSEPSKKVSLAFLDDDDLLFDDNTEQPNVVEPKPQASKRPNLYVPSSHESSLANAASRLNQQANADADLALRLSEGKKKNNAYDFSFNLPPKVLHVPKKPLMKPSRLYAAPTASGPKPAFGHEQRSSTSGPGTIVNAGGLPQASPKSFFEELPLEMPKPVPRAPKERKPNTLATVPPAPRAPPSFSPKAPPRVPIYSKPNPYAPKADSSPPAGLNNIKTGVLPPPSIAGSGMGRPTPTGAYMDPNSAPLPPPPSVMKPSQLQPFPHVKNSQSLQAPYSVQNSMTAAPPSRKSSNPPPPNAVYTSMPKQNGPTSATSPYVPNAGPYAPSLHRRTHSRASSLVGGKGKEINPYAPAFTNTSQSSGPPLPNNASLHPKEAYTTGVVPPSNPVASPQVGPMVVPGKHVYTPLQQLSDQSQPQVPGLYNRVRGISNATANAPGRGPPAAYAQAAPKVQNPQLLLQRQFPIFSWSNSSNVAYLVPKMDTAYGNVNNSLVVGSVTKLINHHEMYATFPGPLSKASSKTKRKEVEKWLEANSAAVGTNDPLKSASEVILNQVLLALVQNSGEVGSPQFVRSVSTILNPNVNLRTETPPLEVSSSQHHHVAPTAHKLDANGLSVVMGYLQGGKLEDALAFSTTKGDWAMALMIAHMAGRERFQKVASDYARMNFPFQKSQSKVHHLMPIILKAASGASASVVQDFADVPSEAEWAIQHWREIVSLIYINGSKESVSFCKEFGKFLGHYPGLSLARDVCFILAGVVMTGKNAVANGTEDTISVIGGDTQMGSIYSECYEFALQLSPTPIIPAQGFLHLLPVKVKFAQSLADYGLLSEAQKYCDFLGPQLKTIANGSHPTLTKEFQSLVMRITSTGDLSGWFGNKISKVNLDKMWGHLDKFIGGDELKTKGEEGVFSKFSPSVSRTASTLDVSALPANGNNSTTPYPPYKPMEGAFHLQTAQSPSTGRPMYPSHASDSGPYSGYTGPMSESGYNHRIDSQDANAPPRLNRNNTTIGIQKYAPASAANHLPQPNKFAALPNEYASPQVPNVTGFESNQRYPHSNISSLSLPLQSFQQDNLAKKAQNEGSLHLSLNKPAPPAAPFAYLNSASQYSNLSISSQMQVPATGYIAVQQPPAIPPAQLPTTSHPVTQPSPQAFSRTKSVSHSRTDSLEKDTAFGQNKLPGPASPSRGQNQGGQDSLERLQGHFAAPMSKRQFFGSISTENFGNPDAIRAQNHSPSAQSDISLDYPPDFKGTSQVYGEYNVNPLLNTPEKKRDTDDQVVPPTIIETQEETSQDDLVEAKKPLSQIIPPPPPVTSNPPTARANSRVQLRAKNPYAPENTLKNHAGRKNKYGPPPGSVQSVPFVENSSTHPSSNMFDYGGYQGASNNQQQVDSAISNKPKAANVDVSFDNDMTLAHNAEPLNQSPADPSYDGAPKPVSMFEPYQREIDDSLGVGFTKLGEFPVPGSPEYTTRPNSVIGGAGGYFSSRLSQSNQSALYQQYEVEDDTVKDYIPVVEEEEEEEDDEAVGKQREAAAEARRISEEASKEVEKVTEEKRHNTTSDAGGLWFGGWLGGKGDGKPKPIKAKLGQKNAFYYDEKLKKWINKDMPLEEQMKTSAPPPPPKKRTNMATAGAPSGIVGENQPPTRAPPDGGLGKSASRGPQGSLGPSNSANEGFIPPKSISSSSSRKPANASPSLATAGLDDLLSIGSPSVGSATGRKTKRGPKRGYVNVLNQDKLT